MSVGSDVCKNGLNSWMLCTEPMKATVQPLPIPLARRTFLTGGGVSLGAIALSGLLGRSLPAATGDTKFQDAISPLHLPPRIKPVIWLYMSGGPSHLET